MNIILYTGKGTVQEDRKNGHAYNVVMTLLEGYFGKGHAVYMDNFYNSIKLMKKLSGRGTSVTGTLRTNRKGIPLAIKKIKLKKGESAFVRKGNMLIQRWLDDIYETQRRIRNDEK